MSFEDSLRKQFIIDNILTSPKTRIVLIPSFSDTSVDAAVLSLIDYYGAAESVEGTSEFLLHLLEIPINMARRGVKDTYNILTDINQYIDTMMGPEGEPFLFSNDGFSPLKDFVFEKMLKAILIEKGLVTHVSHASIGTEGACEELKYIAEHCPTTLMRLIKCAVERINSKGQDIDKIIAGQRLQRIGKGITESQFKEVCDSVYVLSRLINEIRIKPIEDDTKNKDKNLEEDIENCDSSDEDAVSLGDSKKNLIESGNEIIKLSTVLRPYFDGKNKNIFNTPLLRSISAVGEIKKIKVNPKEASNLASERVKLASSSFYKLLESLLNYSRNISEISRDEEESKQIRNIVIFRTLDRAIKKLSRRINLSQKNEVLKAFGKDKPENDKDIAIKNILDENPLPEISVLSLSMGICSSWKLIHIEDVDLRWLLNSKLRCDLLFGNGPAMVSTKQLITKMKEFETEKRTLLPIDEVTDGSSSRKVRMSPSTRLFVYILAFLRIGFCATLSTIRAMERNLRIISYSFERLGLDVTKFKLETLQTPARRARYGLDDTKLAELARMKISFEAFKKRTLAFRSLIIFTGIIGKHYDLLLNCCQLFFTKDVALREKYADYPITDYCSRYLPSCIIKCLNGVSSMLSSDFKIARYFHGSDKKISKVFIFLKLVIDGSSSLDERINPPKSVVRDASECLSSLLSSFGKRECKKWYCLRPLTTILDYELVERNYEEENEKDNEKDVIQTKDLEQNTSEYMDEKIKSDDMKKESFKFKVEKYTLHRFPPDHYGLLMRFFSTKINSGISLSIARSMIQSKLYSNFLSGTIGVQIKILKCMEGIFSSDSLGSWHDSLENGMVNKEFKGKLDCICQKKLPERGVLLTDMGIRYSAMSIQMLAQYVNEYIKSLEECVDSTTIVSDSGETTEITEEEFTNRALSTSALGMSLTVVNLLHMIGLTTRIPQISVEIRNCMEILLVLLYSIGYLSRKTFFKCDDVERKHIYISGKIETSILDDVDKVIISKEEPKLLSSEKYEGNSYSKYITVMDKKRINAIPTRVIIRGLCCELLYRMYKIVSDTPNEEQFLRCVEKEERGFPLFKEAVETNDIHELTIISGDKYKDAFVELLDKIDHIDTNDSPIVDPETINYDDFDDLPEEFRDPITDTALIEPIELPFSHVVINRDTFISSNMGREHMIDVYAPGQTVTMDMLKPRNDILEKMKEWANARLARRNEMTEQQSREVRLFMNGAGGGGGGMVE